MEMLNFSENIISLRRRKGITQEELADFVGVTKASVSKWETKQSLPDILMLPRLAAFFDVSVDELLGYQPQLSREQIQKIYRDLAADFGKVPFEEAMEKSRVMVKKYYSCYPFLFQICVLWLNHFMLAEDPKRQREILEEASNLCDHILSDCKDVGLCNDAVILKAVFDMQCGKAREAAETLEEILSPYRLWAQSDAVLIQSYQMAGEMEKAKNFSQISIFLHLISLVNSASQDLMLCIDQPKRCEETIHRIDCVSEAFDLEHLHPNIAAGFEYQAAIVFCMQGKTREALERLESYKELVRYLLRGEEQFKLHGDSYFDALDAWIERLDLGSEAPRDRKVVCDSLSETLHHPAFAILEQEEEFQRIKKAMEGFREG